MTSIVETIFATRAGFRNAAQTTMWPRRTRDVTAASAASDVNDSKVISSVGSGNVWKWSNSQIDSNPSASACCATSTVRSQEARESQPSYSPVQPCGTTIPTFTGRPRSTAACGWRRWAVAGRRAGCRSLRVRPSHPSYRSPAQRIGLTGMTNGCYDGGTSGYVTSILWIGRTSEIVSDRVESPARPEPSGRRGGQIRDPARNAGDAIAAALAERILSGELAPDDRLPSERRLAVEFGASRPMVREALRSLVERGLIEVEAGRGAFVRGDTGPRRFEPLDLEYRRRGTTARQLSETRLMLETEAAALATVHADAGDLGVMAA